ncbi:hypothetical protein B0H19DRAFT_1263781 [Mycena capillaripes]|nr:hypothetical protein B0H19DRAFT_1263781 [Mycena capillaripes]
MLCHTSSHQAAALRFARQEASSNSSIYRIIELGTDWHGRIMRTEVYFSVLDGGMVALAVFTLNSAHSGQLMGSRRPVPPKNYGMKLTEYPGTAEAEEA